MTDYLLMIPIVLSFLVTLFFIPFWIRRVRTIGLVWDDMNKSESKKVAGAGGIIAILGCVVGLLSFVAYRTFILENSEFLIEIFALLISIIFLAGVGLIDDLFGWQQGGLRRRHRVMLAGVAAIPLMAVNAGKSIVSLPFYGSIDLGIFYPLIIIPLGVIGASTTFNFLAGYNGLEAGQGIFLLGALALVAHSIGSSWIVIVCLCAIAALLAFLIFNFYPAKVFPGDSLTYGIGGLIAIVAILGNFEKIAVFFFIPCILEVLLKSRGRLVKHSFGKPDKKGGLTLRYDQIYSLNHLAIFLMKRLGVHPTEVRVVVSIWVFQLLIIVIGFMLFDIQFLFT